MEWALYRGLNFIDGCDIVNINCDDASGYRLDTLATHSKHGTPAVSGQDVLTTHTDFVNWYASIQILQTTLYNFTATKTTKEMCDGIMKTAKFFPKNPAQHYADLEVLCNTPEFKPAFYADSGLPKRIEGIRVDGASDEGPAHEEVRF